MHACHIPFSLKDCQLLYLTRYLTASLPFTISKSSSGFAITLPHLGHFVSSSGLYIRFIILTLGSGEGGSKKTVLNVIVTQCPQHACIRLRNFNTKICAPALEFFFIDCWFNGSHRTFLYLLVFFITICESSNQISSSSFSLMSSVRTISIGIVTLKLSPDLKTLLLNLTGITITDT